MTVDEKIAKILEELRFQREEINNGQKDLLQHIGRIEGYVAGLSDQLSRTLEVLTHAQGATPLRAALDS